MPRFNPRKRKRKEKMKMNLRCCHVRLRNWQSGIAVGLALFLVSALSPANSFAATVTVKNNCSYTIYPGMYPATYSNGGWTMAAG
jgi:hypothetical protein